MRANSLLLFGFLREVLHGMLGNGDGDEMGGVGYP